MKNKILFFATLLLLLIINSAQAQDTLRVKVYVEGLYRGNGMMDAAPYNADGVSPNDVADTILLKLWAYNTNNSTVVSNPSYIRRGLLKTNGYASFALPSFLTNTNYYIEVSHRNSIDIYSSRYVFIHNGTTIYDFTDSLTKVLGDDQKDLGNGAYGMYAGDINQDGSVDFNDYPDLDIASSNGVLGYEPFDLNGDASVDFNDYPMIDVNSSNGRIIGIFSRWPVTFFVSSSIQIGDLFAGGVVAYILQPGDQGYVAGEIHGLIVAPTDISGMPEWGCSGTNVVGTSNSVGSGRANTSAIANACNVSGIAARLCDNLVLNGYNDWYLPSLEELNKFYQITTINLGRQLSPYWSSSQFDANNSWTELTNSGQYLSQQKSGNHYVRAFRSF